MKKKVPIDVAKHAIELFDFEKGYNGQPPELMDKLERMIGMEGVKWPTADYRLAMISEKLDRELQKILTSYGYVFLFVSMLLKLANIPCRYRLFSYYSQDKKLRLKISPEPGQEHPPLPEWLQIPYLVPVKGYSNRIIPG